MAPLSHSLEPPANPGRFRFRIATRRDTWVAFRWGAAKWAHAKPNMESFGFSVTKILRDEDFQVLVGLASEARRLQGGLSMIVHTADVIRDHASSPSAVELLLHLASVYGAASASHPTQLSDLAPAVEDDEVIVDAVELKRRVRIG